jgi:hypothetical protein
MREGAPLWKVPDTTEAVVSGATRSASRALWPRLDISVLSSRRRRQGRVCDHMVSGEMFGEGRVIGTDRVKDALMITGRTQHLVRWLASPNLVVSDTDARHPQHLDEPLQMGIAGGGR